MKLKYKMRRGFTLVELLVVIAIIATLAGVGVPVIISQRKKGDRTEAVSNAKGIGLALFNFDQDYGSFPSAGDGGTATAVQENNPNSGYTFGTTNSNDYFRQLIAAGHSDNEQMFYAKAPYTKKPDRNLKGDKCLAAGECGFAYVMVEDKGKRRGLTSADPGGIPVLVAPLVNEWGSCDQATFNNRGVYLRVDGSARSERLRSSDQKIMIGGGLTLFDTGPGTVWGPLKPVVLLPER